VAKHWINGAISHPGALHRELHVPEGEKIPKKKIEKAAHSDNHKLAERAHLAETLGRMHHGGGAHSFRPPATSTSHGYGHSDSQKHGSMRTSGHSGAHRVGKR
jgi:hypothetical protein